MISLQGCNFLKLTSFSECIPVVKKFLLMEFIRPAATETPATPRRSAELSTKPAATLTRQGWRSFFTTC